MPVFRSYPEATSIQPTDALLLDRIGVGTMWIDGLDFVVTGPYLFSFENTGPPLGASEIVGGHVFGLACSLPLNMAGTQVVVDPSSLPAGVTVATVDIVRAGVVTNLGTLTFQTDGSSAFATSAWSAQIGDLYRVTGPLLYDTHLANIFFTGVGTLV